MSQFAKLFELPKVGQVLIVLDANSDSEPAVRWTIKPPELGLCSYEVGFENSDAGWEDAEKLFQNITMDQVKTGVSALIGQIRNAMGEGK